MINPISFKEVFAQRLLGLSRAYGSILFAEKPWVGALFILATLWFPNTGLAGLLAAMSGILIASVLKFRNLESGLHVYNSLLVGLSLGAYYQLDVYLAVLIVLGAMLAVLVTVAMSDIMWRVGRLPVLSLPFVLVALTVTLAAHSYGTLSRYLLPLVPHHTFITAYVDQFFTALGSAFFIPHPMAGALLFLGVLLTSRYLALLAVAGFIVGLTTYSFLSGNPHPDLLAWNGFNFILVAMALGGIFMVPSRGSFALAMVASMLTALITAASETLMLVYNLPVMALPFLLTSLTVLLALSYRPSSSGLQLLLHAPALPEKSAERARLATVRQGEYGSIPISSPFYGTWSVYQGFDGEHTHQAPWQHAFDFYIEEHGKSYRTDGVQLEDYYCFSLPVLAPVSGYMVQALHTLPDNAPGQVDADNNWGNYALIRMHNGLYALLAHLQQHSISIPVGSYVYAGQQIAQCGSSGRSPQPHLHVQVQSSETLGSPTHPFHLSAVLYQTKNKQERQFTLFARPNRGEKISFAKIDTALLRSLSMEVGKTWHYAVHVNEQASRRALHVEISLLGELRLVSDVGASAAFIHNAGVLACYDRNDVADVFLDAWLLALGLTPLNEGRLNWQDQAPLRLLPKTWQQRVFSALFLPLGGGLSSEYARQWQGDDWLQTAEHHLSLPFGAHITAQSTAHIVPHLGCQNLLLDSESVHVQADLLEISQQADAGIPAWNINVLKETKEE